MPTIKIPYGKDHLLFSIKACRLAGILAPSHIKAGPEEAAAVSAALEAPIGSPRLSVLSEGKQRVLVVTSDHTRPMPSGVTLPLLLKEIRMGNPTAEIRILIATGTHRPMTDDEMRVRFGDVIMENETLINHRCDDDPMVFKGILPSGGELWLNALVDWADLIVSEGFIEPHFFAGFSGGRKSILPGIAARKTVLYNHNAAFLRNPFAAQGVLKDNPLHQDMLFATQAAKQAFILNVVLDDDKRIANAFAGDPVMAHLAGCEVCLERTRVPRVLADIAVTSNGGYPLDQNVYQSVKGMTAGEACVKPGGVIILCAALGDGAGGEAFFRWLKEAKSPQALSDAIARIPAEETLVDQWEAQILARVLMKARVVFVTGEENRTLIEDMHMTWAPDLPSAMDIAEGIVGLDASVVAIPDGVGVVVSDL